MSTQILGGVSGLIAGPPGTGKSNLLGSAAEICEKALLLAPKPREVNSYLYRKYNVTSEVFRDSGWHPALKRYESGAYERLYQRVVDLYDDIEHDFILLDPFTDVALLASHDILKAHQVETPSDLPGKGAVGFYGALRYKLKQFTQALTGLASPDVRRPKHVFVAVHTQPVTEEDIKGAETREGKAKGVEFFGDVLPMVEGGYRREIAGEFDIMGFSSVVHELVRDDTVKPPKMVKQARYVVQLNADPEKHAKVALVPRLAQATCGNTMRELFALLGLPTARKPL